ncbi:MAG: hypothetical protein QOC63_4786 [Mycobacterium sp.]|jgi:hypothetical protein|nr:hypothetical protein [Mycobacterium sp.]
MTTMSLTSTTASMTWSASGCNEPRSTSDEIGWDRMPVVARYDDWVSSKSKRRKSDVQQTGRRVLGLINYHGEKRPCGICGVKKLMSRSHVPAQCAGNEMLVKRYRLMVNKNEVDAGRQDFGGIHLYGLCGECNTQAGDYDTAYGDLSDQLRIPGLKSWQLHLPPLISLPSVTFDPGAVVRSILLGMCATGPLIRRHWPAWPGQLVSGSPVTMPPELRLFLALTRGATARVAGPIAGFPVAGPMRRDASGKPVGINAVASVYFPPLAWELIHAGDTKLTDDGWVDVTSWTTIEPGDIRVLTDLVPALPAVCHPWHDP